MDVEKRIAEARSLAGVTPVAFEIADLDVLSAPAGAKSPGGVRFYAAVYNTPSLDLGGFREIIAPGFADASIAEDDIRALVNHDANLVLGRSAPAKGVQTAEITSDARGVLVDVPELPATDYAAALVENLRAGNVDQSSFGFRTVSDAWAYDAETDTVIRTLTEARLLDVSVVTFPAYPDTIAEARTIALALAELRSGKILSSKSRKHVQDALAALTELLAHAGEEENSAPDAENRDAEGVEDDATDVTVVPARLRLREFDRTPVVITHYERKEP